MNSGTTPPRLPSHGPQLEIGPISFNPATGELTGPGGHQRLDPKVAEVLRVLCSRAGEVVSRDELLASVWPDLVVTDDVLRRCIYQLRSHLQRAGGEVRYKTLLETLPKRGYRIGTGPPGEAAQAPASASRRHRGFLAVAAALAVVVIAAWLAFSRFAGEQAAIPVAPAIAVLPFDDLSEAQDQRYFAEGLAEEILNLLAQLPELRVIARTSSFSFRGRDDLDIPAIGQQLGVTHLLEGSVRRMDDRVRITAQLVRSSDGSHVWSRTYDRDAGDMLEMQSDIAADIARILEIRFEEGIARMGARAVDPKAHEQYLLARFLWSRRSPGDLAMARRHLELAVELDPGHAQAWALLSGVAGVRIFEDGEDPEASLETMRVAVGRALALAPGSGEVHARAAQYHAYSGDFKRASGHFQQALALAPNDLLIVSFSAGMAMSQGRFGDAVQHQRRAVERDPVGFVTRVNFAAHLRNSGRYEQAWREIQQAQQLNPDADLAQFRAGLLVLRGRHDEALEAALTLPAGPQREQLQALAYGGLGRRAEADAALAELRERDGAVSAYCIAEVLAWRGEPDAAFEQLERAWNAMRAEGLTPGERRGPFHFLDSGFLHPLHGDPRLARYYREPPQGRPG